MSDKMEGFAIVDEPAWKGSKTKYAPLFFACATMPDGKCMAKTEPDVDAAKKTYGNIKSALVKEINGNPVFSTLRISRQGKTIYIFKEAS